jgi:hypothetical protein
MTTQAQTQIHARFRSDTGTVEASPTWFANEDTNYSLDVSAGNVFLRVRVSVQENSTGSSVTSWILRASKNGGAYANITTSGTDIANDSGASSSSDEAATTTQRLTSGTGSYVAGLYDNNGAMGNISITANNFMEFEYGLVVKSAGVADGDTFDFRVYRSGSTAFSAYTVTPRITIIKASSGQHRMFAVF